MRLQLTVALVILTGCSNAYIVSDPKSNPGIVKYLNDGPGRSINRQEAYNQMRSSCGGDYKIIEELSHLENDKGQQVILPDFEDVTHRYSYIHFECIKKKS
jgi:hypothetical protein